MQKQANTHAACLKDRMLAAWDASNWLYSTLGSSSSCAASLRRLRSFLALSAGAVLELDLPSLCIAL